MAHNKVRLDGLQELRDALRQLPTELADDARGIVLEAAEKAKAEIVAAYPRVTGNLRKGVQINRLDNPFGTRAIVVNRAPHATIYEVGTAVRRNAAGKNLGSMPPGHVFSRIAPRWRRWMTDQLITLVRNAGFTVNGG